MCIRDRVEIIPCLGDKGAVGDDDLAVPVYGAEQEGELFDLAGQVLKRIAHQKVFLHQAEAHQLHPAPTEGLDIGGRGEAQQPGDLHSGGILRIDDHVDAQVPLQLRQEMCIRDRVRDRSRVSGVFSWTMLT